MSVGNKKRKRDQAPSPQPAKVRVAENDAGDKSTPDEKARGQLRQAKSERRSKKTPKKQSKNRNVEPKLLTPTPTKVDNLANGENFVSLSVDEPASESPPTPSSKLSKPQKKKAKSQKTSDTADASQTSAPDDGKSKKDRFILFIGNLPYAATNTSIANHFAALQPFTVRHNTEKTSGRSKGFAFLEFENYDKMKTCLKLYHHSMFDPDSQPPEDDSAGDPDESFVKRKKPSNPSKEPDNNKPYSKNARRINVELTAGGGGKSKQRKDKIEQKNKKLSEERERRHAKEAVEKSKAAEEKKERPATGANADEEKGDERGNIHPSRMKRVGR